MLITLFHLFFYMCHIWKSEGGLYANIKLPFLPFSSFIIYMIGWVVKLELFGGKLIITVLHQTKISNLPFFDDKNY